MMRGSQTMRPSTPTVTAAASQRSDRPRPLLGDPGDAGNHQRQRHGEPALLQREAEGERQSEAIAPVAKMALAASLPGRSPRLLDRLGGEREGAGKKHGSGGEGNRAIEAGDAVIERDEDGDRGEDGGRAPQNADQRIGWRAAGREIPTRRTAERRRRRASAARRTDNARASTGCRAPGPRGGRARSRRSRATNAGRSA